MKRLELNVTTGEFKEVPLSLEEIQLAVVNTAFEEAKRQEFTRLQDEKEAASRSLEDRVTALEAIIRKAELALVGVQNAG